MGDTIPKLMLEHARREPELTIQWSKDATGTFQPVVWRQVYGEVEAFAAGLLSLGVRREEHIGMVSENMKEWLWADLAILSIGAADVPRGSDSMAPEIQYILDHVPDRNKFIPIGHLSANPYAIPLMWDWYEKHLNELEQFHPIHYERVITGIVPFGGLGKEEKVKGFFKNYMEKNEKAKDAIKLSLERLEINSRMRRDVS